MLRRTLFGILTAISGCCDTGYREFEHLITEPPPPEYADLVRACGQDLERCNDLCRQLLAERAPGESLSSCEVDHTAQGHVVHVAYHEGGYTKPCGGRRPCGLADAYARGTTVGRYLARSAWFEGASVHAFVRLACELAHHGAPESLRDRARIAALDEVRHARAMHRLARSYGARRLPIELAPPSHRPLEAIAIENAVEGMVGETWAALVACWQATHAPDPAIRAVYASIADDEVRHAELAFAIDTWTHRQLAPTARRRVIVARHRAIHRLEAERPADRALVDELGLPDGTNARALHAELCERVWS